MTTADPCPPRSRSHRSLRAGAARRLLEPRAVLAALGAPGQRDGGRAAQRGHRGREAGAGGHVFRARPSTSDFSQAVRTLNAQGYPREQLRQHGQGVQARGLRVLAARGARAADARACRRRSPTPSPTSTAWSPRACTWWCPSAIRCSTSRSRRPPRCSSSTGPSATCRPQVAQIKALVVNSIEGLPYDNVTVALFPAEGTAAAADAAAGRRARRSTSACCAGAQRVARAAAAGRRRCRRSGLAWRRPAVVAPPLADTPRSLADELQAALRRAAGRRPDRRLPAALRRRRGAEEMTQSCARRPVAAGIAGASVPTADDATQRRAPARRGRTTAAPARARCGRPRSTGMRSSRAGVARAAGAELDLLAMPGRRGAVRAVACGCGSTARGCDAARAAVGRRSCAPLLARPRCCRQRLAREPAHRHRRTGRRVAARRGRGGAAGVDAATGPLRLVVAPARSRPGTERDRRTHGGDRWRTCAGARTRAAPCDGERAMSFLLWQRQGDVAHRLAAPRAARCRGAAARRGAATARQRAAQLERDAAARLEAAEPTRASRRLCRKAWPKAAPRRARTSPATLQALAAGRGAPSARRCARRSAALALQVARKMLGGFADDALLVALAGTAARDMLPAAQA